MPTFRAADPAATPSAETTLSVTNPSWNSGTSSTPVGDIVLIWCAAYSSSLTWSATGFTARPVTSGTSSACQLLWRVTNGTEGATFSVTASASHNWAMAAVSLYNANQAAPFDPSPPSSGQVSGSLSTTVANAGVTTRSPGDILVWFGAVFSSGSFATLSVPAGYSAETAQTSSSASGGGASVIAAIITDSGTGATGAVNGSASATTLNATALVGIQIPSPPAAFTTQRGLHPRYHPQIRRGAQFAFPMPQANQGVKFPLLTSQAGSRPRWAPKLRRGASFAPVPPQGNQGVQFPLVLAPPGTRPRWAPKLRRGAFFMPVPPQGNQGVRFPLFTRQFGGVLPRWAPKLRRGAFFMPGWGQTGDNPGATQFFRQSRPAPRWLPSRRLVQGRVFEPGWGQASQGTQFPLFTRIPVRTSVRGLLTRVRPYRIQVLPYVPQTRVASAALHASGSMAVSAYLTRHAFVSMQGAGSMHAAGIRTSFGTVAMEASGSLRAGGLAVKQAAAAMHASGSMAVAGQAARVASVAMSGSGTMTASATDLPGVVMTARGRMSVHALVTQQGAAALGGSGYLSVSASSGAPPREILIEPGAMSSPSRVTAEGTWEVQAPFAGPSEVTVPGIADGQFDDGASG